MNVDAFDAAGLDGPPELLVLCRTLAAELDRQVAEGKGVNAALVREYVSVLEVLRGRDDADPIAALLAEIRDAEAARPA